MKTALVERNDEIRQAGMRFGLSMFAASVAVSISAANAAWGGCFLFLAAEAYSRKKIPWPGRGPLDFPWAAYLAVVVLVSAVGVDPARSFGFIKKDLHKVWLFYLFATVLIFNPHPRAARWLFIRISYCRPDRAVPSGRLARLSTFFP